MPLLLALLLPAPALAQEADAESPPAQEDASAEEMEALEARLAELEAAMQEAELQRLLHRAEIEAALPQAVEDPEARTFASGSRAMQRTNPEISVAGDVLFTVEGNDDLAEGRPVGSGAEIRALGVHVQSVLDPYSVAKIAFDMNSDHELNLEELYVTWSGIVPSMSFTVGRFRQHFGQLNRWHDHDLDQVDYPEVIHATLGDGGLVSNGLIVTWFMPPIWAHANELQVEITDGDSAHLFSGERFSVPSGMARLKSYYDLSEDTYLELGLSGLYGWNTTPWVADPLGTAIWAPTGVAGADLTLYWSPLERAKYASFTWRSEAMLGRMQKADGTWTRSGGAYSYVMTQAGPKWFLGVRGDLAWYPDQADPVVKVVPFATFWQSEFVYLRGEYRLDLSDTESPEHMGVVQVDFAAGPHKHEKY